MTTSINRRSPNRNRVLSKPIRVLLPPARIKAVLDTPHLQSPDTQNGTLRIIPPQLPCPENHQVDRTNSPTMAKSQDCCTKRQCARITLPKTDRLGTIGASDGWLARRGFLQTTAREPGKRCIALATKTCSIQERAVSVCRQTTRNH
jgi:hypothetical protein